MNIEIFEDKDIEILKEQIRFLEIEISLTAAEKADIEKQIHQYEVRYNEELGDLIKEILEKRKEKLKKEAHENATKQKDYEQAEYDYQDFKNSYEEIKKTIIFNLTTEEQLELKTKFKKACKLCHPDKVADHFKDEAQSVFVELKSAYDSNNLKKVSEILEQLEKGIFKTGSEIISAKSNLEAHYNKLKHHLTRLKSELKELKNTEIFKILASVKDIDSYFDNIRLQLIKELNSL